MKKKRYPGTEEAEQERKRKRPTFEEKPDWICGAPNYEKFQGMTPEEVLVWLNID